VYRASSRFPRAERDGLAKQIRRAVVSVPSNIAEGNGGIYRGVYARHVAIAHGSLMEVETQLIIAHDLGFLSEDELAHLLELGDRVGRMLRKLHEALRKET
jgi:four helix bundle protein